MGKKAKYDFTPQLRRNMWEGLLLHSRRQSKTLPEVCADWFDEDWKKAADVLARLQPRELHAEVKNEHNHNHLHLHGEVSQSVKFIEGALGAGESLAHEASGKDGLVLPAKIPAEQT